MSDGQDEASEVEVTPEMIEAGDRGFVFRYEGDYLHEPSRHAIIRKIYLAMRVVAAQQAAEEPRLAE